MLRKGFMGQKLVLGNDCHVALPVVRLAQKMVSQSARTLNVFCDILRHQTLTYNRK